MRDNCELHGRTESNIDDSAENPVLQINIEKSMAWRDNGLNGNGLVAGGVESTLFNILEP